MRFMVSIDEVYGHTLVIGLPGSGIGSFEMWLMKLLVDNMKKLLFISDWRGELKSKMLPNLGYVELCSTDISDSIFGQAAICRVSLDNVKEKDNCIINLIQRSILYTRINEEERYLILYYLDDIFKRHDLLTLLEEARESGVRVIVFSHNFIHGDNMPEKLLNIMETFVCFRHADPSLTVFAQKYIKMSGNENDIISRLKSWDYYIYCKGFEKPQKRTLEVWCESDT